MTPTSSSCWSRVAGVRCLSDIVIKTIELTKKFFIRIHPLWFSLMWLFWTPCLVVDSLMSANLIISPNHRILLISLTIFFAGRCLSCSWHSWFKRTSFFVLLLLYLLFMKGIWLFVMLTIVGGYTKYQLTIVLTRFLSEDVLYVP